MLRSHAISYLLLTIGLASLSSLAISTPSYAADTVTDQVNIEVPITCTLTGTGMNTHTATINPGTYNSNIGTTNMKVICNDTNGFGVYAIGYTDDTDGNNTLESTTLSPTQTIATGTAISGNSQWAMKLSTQTSPAPAYPITIMNSFDSFHTVPDDYTLVAKRTAATDVGESATGSNFSSTYQAFISSTQPADTYVGQVKYVLVHPHDAPAPGNPSILDLLYMQEFATLTPSEKNSVLASMELHELYPLLDERDEKPYWIAKMADGNVWMTQNLDYDIVNGGQDLDSTNTDVPSDWADAGNLSDTYHTETGWESYANLPQSYDPGDLCWDGVIDDSGHGTLANNTYDCSEDIFDNWVYHVGNYYNWTAAIAMSDSAGLDIDYSVDQSICPAGWTLGKTSNQFPAMTYAGLVQAEGLTSNNIYQSPAYFVYGGVWIDGMSHYVGDIGYYWAQQVTDNSFATSLQFISDGNVYQAAENPRHYGFPVRCVVRTNLY